MNELDLETKQVIVMRMKYPNSKGGLKQISVGKMIAQGAHASLSFLSEKTGFRTNDIQNKKVEFDAEEQAWLTGSFAKVCVRVDSEEELLHIYNEAKKNGLRAHLILDSGRTEFNGVPTYTCCAIGPNYSYKINKVTGNLKLL
jgi:PTH2 family peptidyl-tRNA hydrolase